MVSKDTYYRDHHTAVWFIGLIDTICSKLYYYVNRYIYKLMSVNVNGELIGIIAVLIIVIKIKNYVDRTNLKGLVIHDFTKVRTTKVHN